MLKGKYTVAGFTYNLEGYDFGDNIALYLTTPTTAGQKYIDRGIYTFNEDDPDNGIQYDPDWVNLPIEDMFTKLLDLEDKMADFLKQYMNENTVMGWLNDPNTFVGTSDNTVYIGW